MIKVKKKRSNKNPKFGILILNIFYQIFIFILFIIFILLILYFSFKYTKKYFENLLYNIKLTDIYFDDNEERKFDFNFRINDYIYINDHPIKFKIINLFTIKNVLEYLFIIIKEDLEQDNKKRIILSVYLGDENNSSLNIFNCDKNNKQTEVTKQKNKITIFNDEHNILKQKIITKFKYVSSKLYFIPYDIEYILIKKKEDNYDSNKLAKNLYCNNENRNLFFKKLNMVKENFFNRKNNNIKKNKKENELFKVPYFINLFLNKQQKKELKNNKNNFDFIKNNYSSIKDIFSTMYNFLANPENKEKYFNFQSEEFRTNLFNILTKNYYESDICNLKLKYQGSNKIDLNEEKNDIVFRGIYFINDNHIYKNEYKIISKNSDLICSNINDNTVNFIINNSNQPNLFLILAKACINLSKFNKNKKLIDVLSFLFPKLNIFSQEIISLFMENKEIYTSKKVDNPNNKDKNKLLLLDYNIFLFILSNSTDDFLRLLYNNYDGISYLNGNKLIYVKLDNKEKKKKIYNII